MTRNQHSTLESLISHLEPVDDFEPHFIERSEASASALETLYQTIPLRFPALFEQMLVTYRWSNVGTDIFKIHDNPPGEDLSGFLASISLDHILFQGCLEHKLLILGKMLHSYNPVCFNCSASSASSSAIVEVDHESILTPGRKLKIENTIAKDFESLCD